MFERDGFDISIAQLREEYPDSVLGRPHFCEHLMRKGYISSVKEGFEKYLGEGKPYYLPKRRISIAKAVETIVAAAACGAGAPDAVPLSRAGAHRAD